MRKEIVEQGTTAGRSPGKAEWLDLDSIAHVQLTSEDPALPIENALGTSPEHNERGWRATSPGPQTITLGFDGPQIMRRARSRIPCRPKCPSLPSSMMECPAEVVGQNSKSKKDASCGSAPNVVGQRSRVPYRLSKPLLPGES